MRDKVIAIVSKAAKIEPTVLAENLSERIWDSLTHLEIVFLLEEAFDIQLEIDDIAAMRSIDAVMDVLTRILENKK